jgi:hypothetical protein
MHILVHWNLLKNGDMTHNKICCIIVNSVNS